jgi:hypothetical protein
LKVFKAYEDFDEELKLIFAVLNLLEFETGALKSFVTGREFDEVVEIQLWVILRHRIKSCGAKSTRLYATKLEQCVMNRTLLTCVGYGRYVIKFHSAKICTFL